MNLQINHFWFRYETNGHDVLRDINFEVKQGSYWAILGPNGSGKTTLLKAMAGLLLSNAAIERRSSQQIKGSILLDGKELESIPRREIARTIAFVPGTLHTEFPLSVREFVVQGRYPHSSLWMAPTRSDYDKADYAIKKAGLDCMHDVKLMHLSAGEKQLALIARALTQEPRILLLDETLSNLDLHYQLQIFRVLQELNDQGTSIVLVCHDFNFASEFCPQSLWLKNGTMAAKGALDQTLTTELIQSLYPNESLVVAANPFTGKPKVYLK